MIILTILKSISFFSVLYKKQLSIFFLNIIMLKQTIQRFINKIQPDIIHLEEIPEFFMDFDIAKQIYTQDRKYIIVETSQTRTSGI